MSSIPNIMISASAGSGKTYQLVRRYIHLLALGVDPSAIAAMTFTRKAAGEFFSRILRALVELSNGALDAKEYFKGISPQPPANVSYGALIRLVIARFHRLRLGTLDSFFASVAASFPLELGLPAAASIMSEDEASEAIDDALRSMLDTIFRNGDDKASGVLLEAYKQGTYGREDKTVFESLEKWVAEGHQYYLESPSAEIWGNPNTIWPAKQKPRPLIWGKYPTLPDQARRLATAPEGKDWTHAAIEKWNAMLEEAVQFQPGIKPGKNLDELLDKCAERWQDLLHGEIRMHLARKPVVISGADARALADLVGRIVSMEYLVRCQRTEGVYKVMQSFEGAYHTRVRSTGRLSFADMQRLLDAHRSRFGGVAAEDSHPLWYRLDARHDHWLFDEFQDTSTLQWRVMGGLMDEVLQDASGRRSFFAVGDPKQSIYQWRGAEPGLFNAVRQQYSGKTARMETIRLATSYRSCPQVLEAVNRTFGDQKALEGLLPGCVDEWVFDTHESEKVKFTGYSSLLSSEDKYGEDGADARWGVTANLLKEIRPDLRGLTCAVLVNSNRNATALAEYLRAVTELHVVTESQQYPAIDNPVTTALLSVLQFAAHPGDDYALEHLRMTPLARILEQRYEGKAARLSADVLRSVYASGFAPLIDDWLEWIESMAGLNLDAFGAHRAAQLREAAAEFDATGGRDIDAFIRHAREHAVRVYSSAGSVQVMTVHKAKGLEFDLVILPDLDKSNQQSARPSDLARKHEPLKQTEWILQMPPKLFVAFDPTLSALRERLMQREGYEDLCQLYVAMTRAKRALYLIAHPEPKAGKAVTAARLLRERLRGGAEPASRQLGSIDARCEFECGDGAWFASLPLAEPTPPAPAPPAREPLGELLRRRQPMARRKTPSGEETFTLTGAVLFARERETGRHLGSLVHELAACIEWFDPAQTEKPRSAWQAQGLDKAEEFESAATQIEGLLANPASRAAFARPSAGATVWRERSFDLIEDGEWISGVMDRLIIDRDTAGKPISAWLVDFKTDEIAGDEALRQKIAGYTPQVQIYVHAVRRLTGLPQDKIRASLLFTRSGRLEDVSAE